MTIRFIVDKKYGTQEGENKLLFNHDEKEYADIINYSMLIIELSILS